MQYQHSLLYLLATLPSALCITTIQAYLAPTNAGASVLSAAPSATTYSILCTSLCAAAGDNNQATLVNGPSTAGFTNTMDGGQKTLILDCKLTGKSDKAECVRKAISTGQTVSQSTTLILTKADVVITAGIEQLGYKVVTATAEVNVTHTAATITSGTETVTSGVPKTTTSGTPISSFSSTASQTSSSASRAGVVSSARPMGEPAETSSSRAAAPTMSPERVGAALIGLAGFMLAAL